MLSPSLLIKKFKMLLAAFDRLIMVHPVKAAVYTTLVMNAVLPAFAMHYLCFVRPYEHPPVATYGAFALMLFRIAVIFTLTAFSWPAVFWPLVRLLGYAGDRFFR